MIDFREPWPFGLNRRNCWLFAGALVIVVAGLLRFDHDLSVVAHAQPQDVIDFFDSVTRWGESDWLLIPSAALLAVAALCAWLIPRRLIKLAFIELSALCALVFVGVGLPSLVANIVKRLVGRGRPEVFDAVGSLAFHPIANDFFYESFPSGHTTTAFSAALVLGFLAPRWFGWALIGAIAIGASRLVLGVHYPTDVLCGATLGTLGAYAVRNFFATRGWAFKRAADGGIVGRRPAATQRLLRRFQRRAAR